MTEPADIASLSFEQALAELEAIVQELESGHAPLERSIEMYELFSRMSRSTVTSGLVVSVSRRTMREPVTETSCSTGSGFSDAGEAAGVAACCAIADIA